MSRKTRIQPDTHEFADDLRVHYGVTHPAAFAAHVLGRKVRLEDLSRREQIDVRVAARAAYAPVEQAEIARQNARFDSLTNAQMIAEGSRLLGL